MRAMDLAEFCGARLDEEEAHIDADDRPDWLPLKQRARREVAARRAVLKIHAPDLRELNNPFAGPDEPAEYEASCPMCEMPWPCPTVRYEVSVWSDHPDYRQEWKP